MTHGYLACVDLAAPGCLPTWCRQMLDKCWTGSLSRGVARSRPRSINSGESSDRSGDSVDVVADALPSRSEFGRNAFWFTALSAFDRVIAVVQTVVISRTLGITEYGVYGLLFGTIGLVASIVGMQMGLTATVFVAKFRVSDKAKAAAVISIVGRFGLIVATFRGGVTSIQRSTL